VSFDERFHSMSAGAIALGLLAAILVASEVCYRLGKSWGARPERREPQLGAIEAALLGLVALLLGFTFSLSATRFDARKKLVVEEANAIGTTYRRASLLPDDARARVQDLLRRYVAKRVEFYRAPTAPEVSPDVVREEHRLQRVLWAEVAALGRTHPNDEVTVGLLSTSLTEMMDLEATQATAFEDHVPPSVLLLVFFVSIVGLGSVGYVNGFEARRHGTLTVLLALMCTLTVFVILDLDRPREGIIRITQKPMTALEDLVNEPSAPRG
jgi:hypothetical protein